MPKPKHSFKFYFILSSFFAIMIFASGISIGAYINSAKEQYLSSEISSLKESVQDAEIEMIMLEFLSERSSCTYLSAKSAELMQESNNLGTKVDTFEQSNTQRTDEYISLKSDYMKILIKNWITSEKIKTACGSNYTTILYFYKTEEECPDCTTEGYILSHLKEKYYDSLMIFAIDSSLNLDFVSFLEQSFNVTEYPSIVINNNLLSGFTNMTQIEENI